MGVFVCNFFWLWRGLQIEKFKKSLVIIDHFHATTIIIALFLHFYSPLCISPVDNLLEDHFDDTLDDDVIDDGHEEIDLNDPVERPPEPTVPDERVASSSDEEPPNDNNLDEEEEDVEVEEDDDDHDEVPPTTTNTMTSKMTSTSAKDSETTRKISSLLSELVGDHPSGEVMANREIVR